MKTAPPLPTRGRPRSFDPDTALDQALQVFWRKGYEGTSLSDLTEALGINRPSLYAAFGNKEELFRKALSRYASGPAGYFQEALARPTVREAIARLFDGSITMFTDPRNPPGCLVVQGALSCGDEAKPIREELAARRAASEQAIRKRLKQAITEGELTAGTDAGDLARFIATVMHGMSVQAAGGAGRKELKRVADIALRALSLA